MSNAENKNNNTSNNRRSDGHLRVDVLGRITNDPEVREVTKNGKTFKVCSNMAIAINPYGVDKPIYVRLLLWGNEAERYAKFLRKGMKVSVAGELRVQEYTKESLTKQYMEINKVYAIDAVGNSNKANNNAESNNAPKEDNGAKDGNQENYPEIGDGVGDDLDGFVEIPEFDDEDLPF